MKRGDNIKTQVHECTSSTCVTRISRALVSVLLSLALFSCSTTSNLPDGEVLYVGMKPIEFPDKDNSEYAGNVAAELEAALIAEPNGALLGSPYYRSPLNLKLQIYNKYCNSETKFGKWMTNHFGSEPVLMSNVNPEVRSVVGRNLLRSYGYFNGEVTYKEIPQKNPRKAKLEYTVNMNHLYTIDTVDYRGFPREIDSLITANPDSYKLLRGAAFAVSSLDAERRRINSVLKNNGYFFWNTNNVTFMADTTNMQEAATVRVMPVSDLSEEAKKKWYLGNFTVNLKRSSNERATDTISRSRLLVTYSGKKIPIRLRALFRDLKLRPRQLYSQDTYQQTLTNLNSLGLFSMTDITYSRRDTTALCDTLDLTMTCVFDKPWDGSIEANYSIKSNNRTGPGLTLGLTKRNAFRGAEKLSLRLKGSYEWQTGSRVSASNMSINSYEYGADVSIEYPRLETPFGLYHNHRFLYPPSTILSLSGNMLNRAGFFRMFTSSFNATYKFQTSRKSVHELTALSVDYTYLEHTTAAFDSVMAASPAIYVSMRNQFIPKIQYTYTYTSDGIEHNPINWQITLGESGNLINTLYTLAGERWNEPQKRVLKTPFAQFLKLTTNLRKTWNITPKSQLVGRIGGGVLWSYGNSERAPYSEQFYVGGANSIRAFTVRSIGPGRYQAASGKYSYLDQTGDIKIEGNIEYRFKMFGGLNGALFLDAGNIWLLKKDESRPDSEFKPTTFFKQLATGTGAGIRYDLDFLVLRLDVGIALHAPYNTGKSGYYNIPKFMDGVGLHFAIGYPF